MRFLYLDTSSSFLYCAYFVDGVLKFSINKEFGKDLSKYSLYEIQKNFKNNKINPTEIDKIVLVNGPGSFTGVRIGITIAKTIAWSLSIPIIVISSLKSMAISSPKKVDFYIPIIDARRSHCYAAIFDSNYEPVLKEQYVNIDTLFVALEKLGGNYVIISNDNYEFEHDKYSPDFLKIINIVKDYKEEFNIHCIGANYLKSTEAEEKLNDIVS